MTASAAPRALLALFLAVGFSAAAPAQSPAAGTAAEPESQLFLFLYRPGPNWVAGRPMAEQDLRPHGAYIRGLLEDGRLFAGGGFADVDGGMAIVRASSLEEAQALLAADPAISSGIFVADLRHWRPRFHNRDPLVAPAR